MVIETLKNLGESTLLNKTPENMQVEKYIKNHIFKNSISYNFLYKISMIKLI